MNYQLGDFGELSTQSQSLQTSLKQNHQISDEEISKIIEACIIEQKKTGTITNSSDIAEYCISAKDEVLKIYPKADQNRIFLLYTKSFLKIRNQELMVRAALYFGVAGILYYFFFLRKKKAA